MKSTLAGLFSVLVLIFSGTAGAQTKGEAVVTDAVDSVVTVLEVDRDARIVTVRGPRGDIAVIAVPPEAQNLDQVQPGSRFKVRYVASVAVAIIKGGVASSSSGRSVRLAPKGDIPGGIVVDMRQIAGVVEAVDYGNRLLSVRGPQGNLLVVKAGDEVQNLEQISVGDAISVEYTESLAMRMIKE